MTSYTYTTKHGTNDAFVKELKKRGFKPKPFVDSKGKALIGWSK